VRALVRACLRARLFVCKGNMWGRVTACLSTSISSR
jgi:hypothetical protein